MRPGREITGVYAQGTNQLIWNLLIQESCEP